MSTVAEIEEALKALPVGQAHLVADWLQDYLDGQWDRQLTADAASGRLDKVWQKARKDIDAGNVKPLIEVLNGE
ncbi:MAG: hypothetical protein HC841_02755 [Verrucomicrobiae bacterium]|nr:hypothetical protein [Verrucomicrobiae bacterium]